MKKRINFPKIKGKLCYNEPLSAHTTFRIGGPCATWVEPQNEKELKNILKFARSKKKKIFIIGAGSNILFRDRAFNGIMIHLGSKNFRKIHFTGTKVTVGAGAMLSQIIMQACKNGLSGIEGLVGIPGTMGGAIFMNSGYNRVVTDSLDEIKVMERKSGNIRRLKTKNIKFAYRHSGLNSYIMLEATLRLKKNNRKVVTEERARLLGAKKKTQPLRERSAGCVFKNPDNRIPAALYIEMSQLKGRKIGDAKISEKHANFIINTKSAKANDVLRLINLVRKRVKSRFNINLIPEIEIV
ncbi:MAG: UDP-N-acetylmuramate dehydrogenase [Candidatus Omnitrophica bacterium]|nr:UDP-N-acetylmuramate dehydrogenase [Candidatus Omnitrophota bacterium]